MARNFSNYNSARTRARDNQAALEGLLIISNNSAAALVHADVDGITEWATANTDINIALTAGNIYGDGALWGSVASNSLTLKPGTYRVQFNIACRSTVAVSDLHWAITNAAFTEFIAESLVGSPMNFVTDEDHGQISSIVQFTIATETALKFHIACPTGDGVFLAKGDFGQILVSKVS